MVYRKKYVSKKYSRNSRKSNKTFAQRVKKVLEKEAETKYSIASTTDTSLINTSGTQHNCIGTITQGDAENERIGDKIKVKDLQIRLTLKSGTVSDLVRVYLYQTKGDLANFGGSLNDLYPQSFFPTLEETNGNVYKVLFNRVYQMAPDINETKFLQLTIPAKKLLVKNIEFDAGLTTIMNGAIQLGIETTNTTASQMTAQVDTKLRYYD